MGRYSSLFICSPFDGHLSCSHFYDLPNDVFSIYTLLVSLNEQESFLLSPSEESEQHWNDAPRVFGGTP